MKITPAYAHHAHPLAPIAEWYLKASPGDGIDVTELGIEYAAMTPTAFEEQILEAVREVPEHPADRFYSLDVTIETLGRGRTASGFRIVKS
jgi:hypothetical protein